MLGKMCLKNEKGPLHDHFGKCNGYVSSPSLRQWGYYDKVVLSVAARYPHFLSYMSNIITLSTDVTDFAAA
jgi:hypothetical protein